MTAVIKPEHEALRALVRRFVDEVVEPRWMEIEDKGEIPEDILARGRELGLYGVNMPKEYGGMALGEVGACVLFEELSRTNGAITLAIGPSVPAALLAIAGTEEQKQKYLPALTRGDMLAAFAVTEPEAGSDAASIQTRAEKQGNEWVINGEKMFAGRSTRAGVWMVAARTADTGPDAVTLFLVDRGTPGLHVGKPHRYLGLRGVGACPLKFENCRVPESHVVGQVGQGFRLVKRVLASARVWVAARAVGAAGKCLELAVNYARQRKQFGKFIGEFQGIQNVIADCVAELEPIRHYVYEIAARIDQGLDCSLEAAICKLKATELAFQIADHAIQIHGGRGYLMDTGVERFWRDVRAYRILEGTSDIQRRIIARKTLRL